MGQDASGSCRPASTPHQYEPHDAPDPMTRDFYVAAVVTVLCLLGAAVVLVFACGGMEWAITRVGAR